VHRFADDDPFDRPLGPPPAVWTVLVGKTVHGIVPDSPWWAWQAENPGVVWSGPLPDRPNDEDWGRGCSDEYLYSCQTGWWCHRQRIGTTSLVHRTFYHDVWGHHGAWTLDPGVPQQPSIAWIAQNLAWAPEPDATWACDPQTGYYTEPLSMWLWCPVDNVWFDPTVPGAVWCRPGSVPYPLTWWQRRRYRRRVARGLVLTPAQAAVLKPAVLPPPLPTGADLMRAKGWLV